MFFYLFYKTIKIDISNVRNPQSNQDVDVENFLIKLQYETGNSRGAIYS